MLKTQTVGKKGKLSKEEKFLAYFARNFEFHKPQRTVCKDPKGISATTVDGIIFCFYGTKRLVETNVSTNGCFHRDKRFWPVILRKSECDKPQKTIYMGMQANLTITVEFII